MQEGSQILDEEEPKEEPRYSVIDESLQQCQNVFDSLAQNISDAAARQLEEIGVFDVDLLIKEKMFDYIPNLEFKQIYFSKNNFTLRYQGQVNNQGLPHGLGRFSWENAGIYEG